MNSKAFIEFLPYSTLTSITDMSQILKYHGRRSLLRRGCEDNAATSAVIDVGEIDSDVIPNVMIVL
jgi:hypothetical protein